MSVLITGGAGYIGSHTVAELLTHSEDVIVLDNLQKGHAKSVPTKTSEKSKKELGWKTRFDDLDEIIRSSWNWHKNHPQGYQE